MNDLIDIGVFDGKHEEEKPLSVEKRQRITGGKQVFEIIVA